MHSVILSHKIITCFRILVCDGRMYCFFLLTQMQKILQAFIIYKFEWRYTFRNPFDKKCPPCNCSLSFAIFMYCSLIIAEKSINYLLLLFMYRFLAHEACKAVSCDGFLHRIPISFRVCNVLMIHQAINSNCIWTFDLFHFGAFFCHWVNKFKMFFGWPFHFEKWKSSEI